MGIIVWYRAKRWLYLHHLTPLAVLIKASIRIIYWRELSHKAACNISIKRRRCTGSW